MMDLPLPLTRDIVLIGGGHTHALVLRKWGMAPLAGARLTLINPGPSAPYSGMLPGFVAGHYRREDLDIDLVRLARFAGARLILGAATGIDRQARQILVDGRGRVGYDLCSIDIGITSDMPALPGFADHAVPAKPLGPFADAWSRYLDGEATGKAVVIGGGVAGVELALAMAHALRARGRSGQVAIIERDRILSAIRPASARRVRKAIAGLGLAVHEGARIAAIQDRRILLQTGAAVDADFVVGAAGARAHGWLAPTGLGLGGGFVRVGPTLQSTDPDIFAVGDCAHMDFAPRPKAGVYAVRQAPVLYDNLRARAAGSDRLRRYRPQDDYLKLISLGGKSALGERLGRPFAGAAVWRLKDRIDQGFMDKFRSLPIMGRSPLPKKHAAGMADALGDKPLCGGCGAKVGRAGLMPLIVHAPHDPNQVTLLPGDDAAVLHCGTQDMVISTDHLRSVTDDPAVMTRIAAHHALGDIWAMGAAPVAATMSLILPPMAETLRDRMLAEIMAAARAVLGEARGDIVGGHTSTGAEFTIGFTLTGRLDGDPITLAGARNGDALILTKPIGSGTILAAEMQLAAPGDHVAAALEAMQQGQGRAAAILAGAHAMTDVTGFGLAGHLTGICEASQVGAKLDLEAVPFLEGAPELAAQGIRSTIFAENRRIAPDLPDQGRSALLFDPQTAGGLLAAVPANQTADLLSELIAAGYAASRIGEIRSDMQGVHL
ncbi:MAG: selenide, water dikinase SelD [Marinibacterium sp.]